MFMASMALKGSSTDVVMELLERGLEHPQFQHPETNQDLMFLAAARSAHLGGAHRIAMRLADLGVPIDSVDNCGQTPLFVAAMAGAAKCAKFLVRKKCDVNHRDRDGQSALYNAFRSGDLVMVHLLVQCECDVELKDNSGQHALSYASERTKEVLAESLLSTDGQPSGSHP
jgi:ankyrin repeat protein